MHVDNLVGTYPQLFHMAERGTWNSIRERGLLSASAVLDLFGVNGRLRRGYEMEQRREMLSVLPGNPDQIVLRDQKPMPPDRLRTALIDGTTPEEWYRLINGKVFFWAERARLLRLLKARDYRKKEHDVLTIDTQSLLKAHSDRTWLCHMNSGNTWPVPHARGKDIFQRIPAYPAKKNGKPVKTVVEVVVDGSVSDMANHVMAVHRMQGEEILGTIWERR